MDEKERDIVIKNTLNHENFNREDINIQEKLELLLKKDPSIYLEKYGKFLSNEENEIFQKYYKNDYEVQFYLKKYYKLPEKDQKIRNRRYKMVNKLLEEGEYFSLEEMKKRRPDIYQEYIKETKEDITFKKDMKLHERLLENYDYSIMQSKIDKIDESETDLIEFDEDDVNKEQNKVKSLEKPEELTFKDDFEYHEEVKSEVKPLTEKEYQFLNFQSEMKRLFIEGLDKDFDYSKVDNDDTFDDVKQMQKDLEDAYFD